MKLYTFFIPENTAQGRLLPLVRRMLPQLDPRDIAEAFRRRDVKQNGKRMDRQAMLIPGAEVKIYLPDSAGADLSVFVEYEDENLLVVRKPAGISCQKDDKGGLPFPTVVKNSLELAKEPLLCHRLDNPTEGLILLAKTEKAQMAMEEGFFHRRIHKRYLCTVKGKMERETAVLKHYLLKDSQKARVRILPSPQPGALTVITEYRVLRTDGEKSLLEITLHTGRTHQIRAHLSYLGHPLLGDDKYGDREWNRSMKCRRLWLFSVGLQFDLEGEWGYLNDHPLQYAPDLSPLWQ